MWRSTCFGLAALTCSGPMLGQNLVVNGGFETYTVLPDDYAQICRATGWSSPTNVCVLDPGCGSPEYYNTLGSGGAQAPNTFWATVMPHTGNGMIGLCPWYVASPDFREYARSMLSAPMVAGQPYQVNFWLTNGVSMFHTYGANHLGIAFSMGPLTQFCGSQIIYTPQVEVPGVFHSSTWQYVSLTFTPAQPFQYICIGNFVPYGSTTAVDFDPGGPFDWGSYYYMDDVVVQQNIALPVQLLAFDATCAENAVVLKWSTATETNNDHFSIERSADALSWVVIGTVPGAGNSQQTINYSFADADPSTVLQYYRVKQVDHDGQYTYTPVVSRAPCADRTPIRQWLIDASGQTIGTWPLPAGSLAQGIYFLRSEFTDGTSNIRKLSVVAL